jgi:tRNA(Ile)-lysidine synthase
MENSSDAFSAAGLGVRLQSMAPMHAYRVAFSGGADSLALLHALCALRESLAPARVDAIHVHHGLHPQADAWAMECARLCAQFGISLDVVRVNAHAERGESPEAAARRARYAALAARVAAGELLCLAHHRRDQAETLLLQLMRGAGPAGLAAMPALARFGDGWLGRPLLDTTDQALRDYLLRAGVAWIEDPGNADLRFDRNYVRHEILPRLQARWPGVERTLARAARHQADSAALCQTMAAADLETARGALPRTLVATALEALPAERARNLLRGWLAECGLPAAGAVHVQQILDTLLSARADATPVVAWPGAEVRRYGGALYACTPLPAHDASRVIRWQPGRPLDLDVGQLQATPAQGRGMSAERCVDARVEVRFRQGGERFRPAGRGHSIVLKKLLQANRVPPWLRDRIPLVYVDGELAAVAGFGVAESYAVGAGRRGWLLSWTALAERSERAD